MTRLILFRKRITPASLRSLLRTLGSRRHGDSCCRQNSCALHCYRKFLAGPIQLLSIAALALFAVLKYKISMICRLSGHWLGGVERHQCSDWFYTKCLKHNQSQVHNTNLNPFFMYWRNGLFSCDISAILRLVLLALSWFQNDLLLNLLIYGWLPLLNLFLFLFWAPMIVCLLGARYRDFYQLVPIFLQLVFLLSPILYQKSNLGAMAWTTNLPSTLSGTQSGSPFTYVWRCSGHSVV